MVDRIRASFKKGFPDLTWMDDQTQKAAEDKVRSFLVSLYCPQPARASVFYGS